MAGFSTNGGLRKDLAALETNPSFIKSDTSIQPNLLDELHPCCIKEMQNKKEHDRVTSQLQGVDRSHKRLETLRETFANPWSSRNHMSCEHCLNSVDYPLLQKLKEEELRYTANAAELPELRMGTINTDRYAESYENREAKKEEEEEEEDSDFGDIDFDDDGGLMDGLRTQMAAEIETRKRIREEAVSIGFSRLVEDSSTHLDSLITIFKQPVALHIYHPDSIADARMEIELEKLAERYLGTKFRRVATKGSTCRILVSIFHFIIIVNAQTFIDSCSNV